MKSCLFLTLVVTTLIFQQSLADLRRDENFEAGLRRNTNANRLSKDQKVIAENRR